MIVSSDTGRPCSRATTPLALWLICQLLAGSLRYGKLNTANDVLDGPRLWTPHWFVAVKRRPRPKEATVKEATLKETIVR